MIQPTHIRRALLVRMDRIGDLVLTLPVDEAIRASFPNGCDTQWWIPPGLEFVTDLASPQLSATPVGKQISFTEFMQKLMQVRKAKYDTAIMFHAPWWVSALVFLAGIRNRVGVKSQWHSFLFLNRAVRQKRSRAEFSELEYNYRLVESGLGIKLARASGLKLTAPNKNENLLRDFALEAQGYCVVHPGMSGSALNWPSENYIELIERTSREMKIVITGTRSDESYLAPLRAPLQKNSNIIWLDGRLNGPQLITILANARSVLAPSTGVLHLAASLGVPTLGLYSPVRVQQPRRWGPQGKRVKTLMPNVDCPGEMSCLGPTCSKYDCMKMLTVDMVRRELTQLENPLATSEVSQ